MTELKPCPWCWSVDYLTISPCGSMTSDMPSRPYRVLCYHIDHDDVQGPVAYGRESAITAWNTRADDAEIEMLREALRKAEQAQWFYYGNDCSSDACRFSIGECIDEDFEFHGGKSEGDHVLQISGARPVPNMWVALHYFTNDEKDERQDDEPYIYTVHATEEEARRALGDPS